MNTLTAESLIGRKACYSESRLHKLFPRPRTAIEVLTLKDGPWVGVPDKDRLWAVLHESVLPDPLMRLFACWCARLVLHKYEEAYRGDDRARCLVETVEDFALGWANGEDLDAAREAAWDATRYVGEAGWSVRAAVWAVWAVTGADARDAAWTAAWITASVSMLSSAINATRAKQTAQLIRMIEHWQTTGDETGEYFEQMEMTR